jgi:hypothetical protein
MTTFSVKIKPHALNKRGNADYCIISLILEIDGQKYFDEHSLFSSYVIEQNEYATDLLQKVVNELSGKFMKRFEIDENDVEYFVDYDDMLNNMKSIRKETLDKHVIASKIKTHKS